MRILLVADIHGNWPALQALREPYDLCLCLGDLVDYALQPGPCIEWVRQHAAHAVRGNHDHNMAQNVVLPGTAGFRYLGAATAALTRPQLSGADLRFLADLPVSRWLTIEDRRFLLVHGSPRDPLDEYGRPDADYWGRMLEDVDADVVCVGHTHVPYVVQVGGKQVINPGSVGQPRDDNPKAAYAIIDNGTVELKRVEYDIEATVRSIRESRLPEAARDLLSEVFRTGSTRVKGPGSSAAPKNGPG